MEMNGLDRIDKKILELIQYDARLSYSEIGDQIGVSRVTVKNRIDNMEEKGIIRGYHTIIEVTKSQDGIQYVIDVEAIPEEYQEVVKVLVEDPGLSQVYSKTGECRFHCVGYAPNHRTLESHVNHLFNHTKGIRKISWHVLVSTLKETGGGGLYERGAKHTGAKN